MKKIARVLLCLVLLVSMLSLAACGEEVSGRYTITSMGAQGMTIEGARRVLSGASPAVASPAHLAAQPATPPSPISAEQTAVLQDALRELRELRALLTSNIAEEKRS